MSSGLQLEEIAVTKVKHQGREDTGNEKYISPACKLTTGVLSHVVYRLVINEVQENWISAINNTQRMLRVQQINKHGLRSFMYAKQASGIRTNYVPKMLKVFSRAVLGRNVIV